MLGTRGRRRVAAAGIMVALLGVVGGAPATVAAATTIVVNTLADSFNASDGKCSLREAIAAVDDGAPSGGVPGECAGGSGTDTITFSVGGTILLASSLPAISAGTLTIDGGNVITIDGHGAYTVINVAAGTVEVRHIVLTRGKGANGGAVTSKGALTLSDVVVSASTTTGFGGGIHSEGPLTLDHVRVTGNSAITRGGGIYQTGDSLHITASRIDHNTVLSGPSGAIGGGIDGVNVAVTIETTTIDGNSANPGVGGGIGVDGNSTVLIQRSTLKSNVAGLGGGMYTGDKLTYWSIYSSTISDNEAINQGGGLSGAWAALDVRGSTISGNHTGGKGGGIYQEDTYAASLVNTTLAGNSSGTGPGAIFVYSNTIVLLHTTVTANTSAAGSGALDALPLSGHIVPRNSIVAGNTNGNYTINVDTYLDDYFGTAVGILDPAGLQDNGGPTKTVKPLKTATAVIGKASDGDGCGNANVEGTDQRGVTRPIGSCDIGAVELESKAPTASAPKAVPAVGAVLGSTVPVRVTASWSDTGGSGVKRFVLQKSVNGGSWSTVTSTMPASGITLKLSTGSSYRFRVKPVDYDGNVGSYTSAATAGTPAIRQQSSATFSGSWASTSSTSYSGGSAKKSSTAGASAKYVFTGRAIGFVTTLGPTRGMAKVYIDGTLKATVDLYAASTTYRVIAWSQRFSSSSSHTIKVVVVGTPSRPRVDVDAFTVLK